MQEFGRPMFPRGSMLGGHLEADKEPGHLVGKGYLRITFDRIILPTGDLPVPSKVIQARGYKVDKEGDIDGKGHAKRDVAEWMFPPLWPWKVVSLPFRGPRPTLKGEEPIELRLMDDIVMPQSLLHPDRPPYASSRPASYIATPQTNGMHLAARNAVNSSAPAAQNIASATVDNSTTMLVAPPAPGEHPSTERLTVLALKSGETYEVTKYQRDADLLMFQDTQGRKGGVDVNEVDWRKTSEMTAAARTAEKPVQLTRQTN
jgi:hypothetical protein